MRNDRDDQQLGLRPADTAAARSEAAKPASPAQGGIAATDKSTGAGDTVGITHSGLLMGKLEELVQNSPVVDQERVAALKDAIASGTYEIDDQRVADKMLRLERDILG